MYTFSGDKVYDMVHSDIIDSVIDEFGKETPINLELIATALYVYYGVKDERRIVDGVVKIKGKKI